ncbi:hypothetical protein IPM62_05320 [Candidatus Woesebacteria bacterium]|nr:MAG: hypothetical protein IPM62_05320 [Candidatus Woesebacteria bacterium]
MPKVLNIYKPRGKTPFEVVKKLQEIIPTYKNLKIGYAGRLDPMAHGVLLILIHPETKNRTTYQNLDKEYEFDLLLGINTDTYDLLGLITNYKHVIYSDDLLKNIRKCSSKLVGSYRQVYPVYSSKTIKGKPLYKWARENLLDTIDIPTKVVNIHSLKIVKIREITQVKLLQNVTKRIKMVDGDFRQDKILKTWNTFLTTHSNDKFVLVKYRVKCQSGTYVRSICQTLGEMLGCGAVAYEIKRTKVGEFYIKDALKVF